MYETKLRFLGMEVLTDHIPLADMLSARVKEPSSDDSERDAIRDFNSAFPGFIDAVIAGHRELGLKNLRPTMVTYFNYRVQVWALGFDADPSTIKRCLPSGVQEEVRQAAHV